MKYLKNTRFRVGLILLTLMGLVFMTNTQASATPVSPDTNQVSELDLIDFSFDSGNLADFNQLAPDADISMIAAGYFHTCALKNGAVFCWGSNAAGQLGNRDSSVTQSNLPVMAISAGAKEISAGGYHTCALLDIGTVYCWGANFDKQSGQPVTDNIYTPTLLSGFFNVDSISAGTNHTCAIKNGGAKCWGENTNGELGDGGPVGFNQSSTHIPQDVVGLTSGVTRISAGNGHSCAVHNGGAKCWGSNSQGELGPGFVSNPYGLSTPQDVVGLTSGVDKISAGTSHSCAVTTGGGAKCWGANLNGQGGNGTNSNISIADDVEGLTSGVSEIVAAGAHSCAITTGGAVKCWGRNGDGYLGNGTFNDSNTPIDVTGLSIEVSAISAPSFSSHTCVLQNGIPKCWGSNSMGELGDNTKFDRNTPVSLYLPAPTFGPLKNIANGTAGTVKDTNNVYLKWKALPLVRFYQIDSKTDDGDWTPLIIIDGDAIRKESLQKNIPASVTCYRIRSWIWTEKSDWSESNCITLNAESKYIDVSISYYSLVDTEKRLSYEEIINHYADAIYEMSNGAHQVRNVYFFLDGNQKHDADVIWNESEWPRAALNGYHYRTGRMWMADVYPFPKSPFNTFDPAKPSNLKGAGYTLAHEFGHYFYGIQDEYLLKYTIGPNNQYGLNWAYTIRDDLYIAKAGYEVKKIGDDWWVIPVGLINGVKIDPNHVPTSIDNYTIRDDKYVAKDKYIVEKVGEVWKWGYEGDKSVQNAVMSSQWNASKTGDLSWLNFSTLLNNNTATNNQFRTYKASSWDTLTRDVTKDPKIPGYFKRVFMPELAQAKTPPVLIDLGLGFSLYWPSAPKIDLPSTKSREKINVVWIEPEITRSLDAAQADSDFSPIIESIAGQSLEYPQPAVIMAQLLKNAPIARATVTTTVTKPDGIQVTIELKDDGISPDDQAEDGFYTGYLNYDQDGDHLVEVVFDNQDGTAIEVDLGAGVVAPDGETRPASSTLVGTDFLEEGLTIVEITGYSSDDHSNTSSSATTMSDDGEDVPGQIDYAGDIDVFEITPTKTGKLSIWLYQFGLEMEADIRIYESDGSTLISSHTFSPEGDNLVFETQIDAIESEKIYVEVKHQSSAATQGMYTISSRQEAEEVPIGYRIFLPLVVR